ncbi:gliding motility-associated C-terminal domain-containing protein [Ekhidna sp.]|uniref:gliding motility-associated C-terminal domain-containing protein n=1 Tax=Reichenbachiellaceae TaxID=2762302 RepID=UPI0032ECB726
MQQWKHILILLLMPMLAGAQVFSSKGRFSVEFDRGCTPMTVNITEHDSFGDVTRQYYYFVGAGITNSKTFTYQDSDTYQIVQVVGADGIDDKTDTLLVQAFASIKPEIEIQKCNGSEVSVTSVDSYYDSIRVYFSSTDSATLLTDQSATFIFSTTASQSIGLKGFFNNANENCNSFFEEVVPIPVLEAPEILNASIKESCKDVFTLYLQLDQIDTLTNYRINIHQTSSSKIYDGYLKNTSLTLQDIIFSKEDYCVTIVAYDPCNNTSQTSTDFCAESTDLSLSPFETLYSTYDSSGIFINLDLVETGTFNVYRKLEDNEFEFRSEETSSFTDIIGSNGRKYFYQIEYVDSCQQVLYTAQTNPPLVEASSIRTNEYQVVFTTPVNSLTEIPSNEYQSGNSFSQTTGEINNDQFTIQLDGKDGSPRQFITATSVYSDGLILKSNAITVRHELVIYVPNAFTPNGDGLNDTLEFLGLPTEIATIHIYNRWGQLIYSSDQPTPGWDGTIDGSLAGQGTYLYEIIFETASGEKRTQKGTFALIKK